MRGESETIGKKVSPFLKCCCGIRLYKAHITNPAQRLVPSRVKWDILPAVTRHLVFMHQKQLHFLLRSTKFVTNGQLVAKHLPPNC